MSPVWRITGGEIALDRARVMGIVNVTPDSFSDGGQFLDPERAIAHGESLRTEGADILDVGGESTRPGATPVSAAEEARRVVPVVTGLAGRGVISIDTTKASVAEAAIAAGATIINDVSAGTEDPRMLEVAARHRAGLVLMHRLARPQVDRFSDQYVAPPRYDDVVQTVVDHLLERRDAAERAGVARESIALDPGLGFGKSVEQNWTLIARLDELVRAHPIVLVGASRKSFVGAASGATRPDERVAGSITAAALCCLRGASVVRVHDVAATRQALAVLEAVQRTEPRSRTGTPIA